MAWGGFNVVQASLNAVAIVLEREIPFHWLWILSGTTYPIASNDDIRAKLASHHPESVSASSPPRLLFSRCFCQRCAAEKRRRSGDLLGGGVSYVFSSVFCLEAVSRPCPFFRCFLTWLLWRDGKRSLWW